MRGILITGGDAPSLDDVKPWLSVDALVVAADSGYDTAARYGVVPDLVVGDMDSIGSRDSVLDLPEEKRAIYSQEKDYTDTELALEALRKRGADEVIVVGGGGGRLDHLLGIVALFDRPNAPTAWILPRDQVFLVQGRWSIAGVMGETLSFFPAGTTVCRMRSIGLKWPLDGLEWGRGAVGISNVATADEIVVEMTSGRLIMVRSRGE
ncbi:thiamine diphosphokinase [Salinispira pacifica]